MEGIIRSFMFCVYQIEEAGRNLLQTEILRNAGRAALIMLGRVQGTVEIGTGTMGYIHSETSLS